MNSDLAQRAQEYSDIVDRGIDGEFLKARELTRSIAKEVSYKVGEQAFMPPQIVALAYILGYGDEFFVNPRGFGGDYKKGKFKPVLPENGVINCQNIGVKVKKYGAVAFKRTAVEQHFKKLDDEGKLHYNPQRFADIVELV